MSLPHLGCPTPQRVTTYSMSPNRQRPLAGAGHAAIFNTFRRFRHQVLYVAPPFIAAYAIMNWAVERYAPPLPADVQAYNTPDTGAIACWIA
ncbi:hypothetical protein ASPBRDRAFT_41253 [Aspergillus brasiliensis CBS 101740]|uniref:Cytochrome b-c1 complex subunit 8 n=1 Tax=Aspergillus brasiliensis (strain CBS 101740 / IMI 381727 / IBT 21946) TaxID=767769 RepID=A0A1L9UPB2_ASPBC|nr:hypothetical protein ASPBRDRAFT_41253 [Aspergillus brasiliensis CBS 101740]